TVSPGQTLPRSGVAQLQATLFDDALPNGVLTASWSAISGPGAVVFTPATTMLSVSGAPQTLNASASLTQPGAYILRLTVSDSEYSASADVSFYVLDQVNLSPTVDAGADQFVVMPNVAVLTPHLDDDGLPFGEL